MQKDQEAKALGKQAVKESKDTTQVLIATLKTAEEGKRVGIETVEQLNEQDQRLDEVVRQGEQLNEEIEEVNGLVRLLNRCWCCFLCWDPPEKKAKQRLAARQAAAKAKKGAKKNGAKANAESTLLLGGNKTQYQATTTNYAEELGQHGLGDVGQKLDDERNKQEQVVGQLVSTLDEMHQIALMQDKLLTTTGQKAQQVDQAVQNARHATYMAHQNLVKK